MFKFVCPKNYFYTSRSNLFSTVAERILIHLTENGSKNVENTLNKVHVELDSTCVNAVLKRCVLDNNFQMGLRFFIWAGMQKSSYRHNTYMYNKACEVLSINSDSKIVYDVIEGYRGEDFSIVNVKMFKVVLNLCKEAKDGRLALWVLRKMEDFNCRPDAVVYSVVIQILCEKNELDESMGLMKEMDLIDLYPGMNLYVVMIKRLCEVGKLEDACALMKNMKAHGCSINVVVFTCLLEAVCKYGNSERALELLKDMEKEGGNCKPNVVTYTTLIKGFVDKGRSVETLSILDQMKNSGVKPNKITFGTLIQGLCEEGHVEEAYKVIEKVVGIHGLYDDCYSSLLLSLWRIGRYEEAESLFKMILANGLRPDGAASSTLIKGLCVKGRLLDAFLLFDEFERSGSISTIDSDIYSTLLVGLCHENHSVQAAKLARIMAGKGVRLKAQDMEHVVHFLKDFGEHESVSHITRSDVESCPPNHSLLVH